MEMRGGEVSGDPQATTTDALQRRLDGVYRRFQAAAAPFMAGTVCRIGCASCCVDVGRVDATTMEAVVIHRHLRTLSRPRRKEVEKALGRDRRRRRQGPAFARCPFLQKNDTCMIYALRPFACRQLYSLRPCLGKGPTVHRRTVDLARAAVAELQRLDANGYSGHLSFVLGLLDDDDFRRFYLAGRFDPGRVMDFARPRGLVINRMVAGAECLPDPGAGG